VGKYHLIGIKGTGMSALAVSLKQLGNDISGSDVDEDFFTSRVLNENDIKVSPFDEKNITDDKIYIISAAYDEHNIEVKTVLEKQYEYYYYHEFIEKYYQGIKIGVSGVHGKTTTTLLISSLLKHHPISAIVGDGTGIGNKDYKYVIFEACEYKNHFHVFNCDYLIINNIDYDHPDFFENIEAVKNSFQVASSKAKVLIINGDDNNCKAIIHNNKYTFGFNYDNFTKAKIKETVETGYFLEIEIDGNVLEIYLPFLGKHMIYNFLASLTLYYLVGDDIHLLQDKIFKFKLPNRRMEEHFYYDNVIIDDYAHHPTEIKACIETVKAKYPNKNIIVLFEPHTYTRTLALAHEFNNCFGGVDELYVAKTFTSKREKYNPALEKKVRNIFQNAKRFSLGLLATLKKYHNSVIIFMGAGNIRKHINKILN